MDIFSKIIAFIYLCLIWLHYFVIWNRAEATAYEQAVVLLLTLIASWLAAKL